MNSVAISIGVFLVAFFFGQYFTVLFERKNNLVMALILAIGATLIVWGVI